MAEIEKFKLPADDLVIRMGQDVDRLKNTAFEELNGVQLVDERSHTISGYVAIKNIIWQLEELCAAMIDYERAKFTGHSSKTSKGT